MEDLDDRAPAGDGPAGDGPVSTDTFTVKAKIFAVGLIDILIDLLLPTLVYVALAPTGQSQAVRLSIGGFSVAAKSVTGRVREASAEGDQVEGAQKEGAQKRAGAVGRFVRALAVAIAAAAATLIASAAGADDTWAIIAGTLVLGAAVIPLLIGRTRIDGFALLVLGEVAISVVLVTISTDARFILVRPAFYTAIAGFYAIATCWTAQPFMMEVTRPIAAGGNPLRAAAFDRAWTTSRAFRRTELAMTFGLGVVLLAEAVLRVVVVYSQPAHAVVHASLVSQLPATVLFVGYLVVIRVFAVPVASREVDQEMLRPTTTSTVTDKQEE